MNRLNYDYSLHFRSYQLDTTSIRLKTHDHDEEGDLRLQSSLQTLLHPLSHLELHRGSPPWGGIVSECKRFVLQNQDIEEEDKRMEATAHGDVKVQLTHMCGSDDGIGPCRAPGGTIVTFPTSSSSRSLLRMRLPSRPQILSQYFGLFYLLGYDSLL